MKLNSTLLLCYFLSKIKKLWMISIVAVASSQLAAQPLNCTGTTVMYATFNDTMNTKPTGIHPVAFLNGAVGPAMGTGPFVITAPDGVTKGTALLAACPYTGRLYYMTGMSTSGGTKDIYSFNPVTGARVRLATTPASLNNYHFVKAAVYVNQYIYALGVHRQPGSGDQVLIRFSTCGASPSAGCGVVEILGYIPAATVPAVNMFNGDLAFSGNGDMYMAVSKLNTATNTYTDAAMYKIKYADLPVVPGIGNIPVSFLYDLDLLDGTAVNGVAFDLSGSLFVSATRPSPAGRLSELYRVFGNNNLVKVNTFGPVPANSIITDLASCVFPGGVLNKTFVTLNTEVMCNKVQLNWEVPSASGISYFEIQQKKTDEADFHSVKRVNAVQDQNDYTVTDVLPVFDEKYEYRILIQTNDGQVLYSNHTTAHIKGNGQMMTMAPNPFTSCAVIIKDAKIKGEVYFKIFDDAGILVWSEKSRLQPGAQYYRLQGTERLAPGNYVLEMQALSLQLTERKRIQKTGNQ
jgi:hypothetical protein